MFLKIYLKELKDSFRDRRTLVLTVLLPLLMMTGLTLFYEKMISDEDETFTLAVQSDFSKQEELLFGNYDNIKFTKVNNPEEAFEAGDAQAALIVSPNFTNEVEAGKNATVSIIGDSGSSKSSALMNLVTASLTVYENQVIANRMEAQGIDSVALKPFTVKHEDKIENDDGSFVLSILIPLILMLGITIGATPSALDLFAGEKEKKTMEALLLTPAKRSTLLAAKWLTISTIGTLTGVISLLVVALEVAFLTENIKQSVQMNDNFYFIITVAILVSTVYSMLMASLLMLASILGKTVKEAQSYSSPISMLGMIPMFFVSTMGINEFTMIHFATPVLNLFSILKELTFGVVDMEHIIVTLASNLVCVIIGFIIARILFLKDKWVMS